MAFDNNSLAATTNSSVTNTQFQPTAQNLQRKQLIIGSYDNTKVGIADNLPAQIFSPADAGDKYGFGSMIHRLAIANDNGAQGLPTYVVPQPEAGGAAAAAGDVQFAASGGLAGTIHLYIAGDYVPFNILTGATVEEIADLCTAAITANTSLPVTAATGLTPFPVDITAKTLGTYGNKVSIEFNLKPGQVFPTGITQVTTDMVGGTGTPVISDALNGLGTGDSANADYYTGVVHGYLLDTTSLDAISTYVGSGNDFTGLYAKTVGRPFRVLTGDTTLGSAGLTALIAISDARLLDRANGVIAVPGSASHPSEIAAQAMGHMERINNNIVAQHYVDVELSGVFGGVGTDNWTSDYDNRDIAVKAGISTTQIKNGVVTIQDVVTFYRPANVPSTSNGYRAMVNIGKLQNIMESIKLNFSQAKWQGNAIVKDATKVNASNQSKVKDLQDVKDDDAILAEEWEANAWIYSASFTKANLAPTVRAGGTGFDNNIKVVLSGVGGILDTVTEFDISLAVFN